MVVVEGATHANVVAGAITMIIIGILLNIVGLGIFCWLLFTLAINALPFFAGATAGIYSLQTGAGPLGAFVVGVTAGGFTLTAGRTPSPLRALPLPASPSGCYLRSQRHAPATMRPSASRISVFPRNGGARH